MYNMLLSSYYMFIMFIMFMIMSIYLNLLNLGVFFEWLIYINNSVNIEFILMIDWISCLFISILFLISSMIMMYSTIYMEFDKFMNRFFFLMIMFIFSMILMIISPNLISILLGWDGLGLVSYCLVIYYQNYSSNNSGMVTVLSNRIGDIGLLMCIGLLMVSGSWNLFLMKYSKIIMLMIVLAAITKSAQLPFSFWLPQAMAAPTPVSALVHSSTLVTAGIYILIRYNKYLMKSGVNNYLMFVCILTMFMAGLMANVEYDLKKIIALSTLSQLGFMMMILSLGFNLLSFFHLLVHAIFKSLLFLCAGVIIHFMSNNQDIRMFGKLNEFMPFIMLSFYLALISLCGFPFMSGFYSKDLIMEVVYSNKMNMVMLILSLLSLMLTVTYSFRLFYFMFFNSMKFMSILKIYENKIMNLSMFFLMLLSIFGGSLLNWLFFYNFNMIFLSLDEKLFTVMICFLSLIISVLINYLKKIKFFYLKYFLSSMWFLNNLYNWINKFILNYSMNVSLFDKVWLEFLSKMIYFNIFKSIKNYLFYYSFKMSIYMSVLIISMIFLYWK